MAGNEAAVTTNFEDRGDVGELLENAPFAIPLPARILLRHEVGVAEIPAASLLSELSGDIEIRVDRMVEARPVESAKHAAIGSISQISNSVKLDLDAARVKPLHELGEGKPRVPGVANGEARDPRVALIRAPKPETNKGRNPNSRAFIRGVMHNRPAAIWLGALITLTLVLSIPAGAVAITFLMLGTELPEKFPAVPGWIVIFPIAAPVLLLAYLGWAIPGRCRICGIRLFVHQKHRKSPKAHHVPLLGHVIPLALHILFFRWFRCTHCGTPIRLKQ